MANVTAFNEMFRQLRKDIDNKEPYTIGPWPFGGPHQSSDLALVLRSAAAHYHAALEDVDLHMSIMMNAAEEIDRLKEIVQKEGFSDGTSICTGCDQRVPDGWPYCAFCGAQGRRPTERKE